jgi:predicted DNA-binding transcriptional regulator AlpA
MLNRGNMSEEVLISLKEAGHLLGGLCEKTVRRRIAAGILPKPVQEGKFCRLFRSDVIRHIERLKQQRDKMGEQYALRP